MADRFLQTQLEAYSACTQSFLRPPQESSGRVARIASLHGHAGHRVAVETRESDAIKHVLTEFDKALESCLTSPTDPWKVQQVVNIASIDRLHGYLKRLERLEAATDFEARAFVKLDSMPTVSPLIVANRDVFLACDDTRLFRAARALSLTGDDAVAWANSWFDDLWDSAPYRIRSRAGVSEEEVERLRSELAKPKSAEPVRIRDAGWPERLAEVSLRRNKIERRLRELVLLKCIRFSERSSQDEVTVLAQLVPESRRPDFLNKLRSDGAHAALETLYWVDITRVIGKRFEWFKREFGDAKLTVQHMTILNDRPDAHAKAIDDADFALQRRSLSWIEDRLHKC